MGKGDDAVRRKRNKVTRKRMRNSETVSARVASIIASKRRRKAGARRICEGMCFSLPTPEDPFNDRFDENKKTMANELQPKLKKTATKKKRPLLSQPIAHAKEEEEEEDVGVSKFLLVCLKSIEEAWAGDESRLSLPDTPPPPLLATSTWGLNLWRSCCCSSAAAAAAARSNLLCYRGAGGGPSATIEQIAWLVSTAADLIARKEKEGLTPPSPFLVYLVPSQQKAIQVRSVCKPLKALGIHTVSLHQGASLDHQVFGLKSCEPEFVVATPDRLLELVSLKAIEMCEVALLVFDGLKEILDFGFMDKIKSIRENVRGDPQIVVFGDSDGKLSKSMVQNLLNGSAGCPLIMK